MYGGYVSEADFEVLSIALGDGPLLAELRRSFLTVSTRPKADPKPNDSCFSFAKRRGPNNRTRRYLR